MTTNYNPRLKSILMLELVFLSTAPSEPTVEEKPHPDHKFMLIIHVIYLKQNKNSPGNVHAFICHCKIQLDLKMVGGKTSNIRSTRHPWKKTQKVFQTVLIM